MTMDSVTNTEQLAAKAMARARSDADWEALEREYRAHTSPMDMGKLMGDADHIRRLMLARVL